VPSACLATSLLFGALCIGIVATVRMPHVWIMIVLFGAGGGFVGSQLWPDGFAARDLSPPPRARPASAGRSASAAWAAIAGPIVGGALLGPRPGADHGHAVCLWPRVVTAALVTILGLHRRQESAGGA